MARRNTDLDDEPTHALLDLVSDAPKGSESLLGRALNVGRILKRPVQRLHREGDTRGQLCCASSQTTIAYRMFAFPRNSFMPLARSELVSMPISSSTTA
jgi:hypothetical protein